MSLVGGAVFKIFSLSLTASKLITCNYCSFFMFCAWGWLSFRDLWVQAKSGNFSASNSLNVFFCTTFSLIQRLHYFNIRALKLAHSSRITLFMFYSSFFLFHFGCFHAFTFTDLFLCNVYSAVNPIHPSCFSSQKL